MCIRIGDAKSGWVNYMILTPYADPSVVSGVGAEFVAVDAEGNMYGGEPMGRNIQKYIRVRPQPAAGGENIQASMQVDIVDKPSILSLMKSVCFVMFWIWFKNRCEKHQELSK